MKSRYLRLIDAKIAVETNPIERARLEARKAAYFARQGDREAALAICATLRQQFENDPNAVVSAWLHLVGGLLDFFLDLNPSAAGKFQRAQALAAAARERSVEALSLGWIAHMNFSAHRFETMAINLSRAFAAASHDDHEALSRCSSICAVAAHLGGNWSGARFWYTAARLHGLEVGDDTVTSACIHNMTAIAAMNLRQAILAGRENGPQEFDLLLEAESAESYDGLVGSISLDTLLPILRAGIHSLQGEHSQALDLYSLHLPLARAQGMERMASWLLADMASCHLRSGQKTAAARLADEAAEQLSVASEMHIDDMAAANSRLAEVFEGVGEKSRAATCRTAAQDGWGRFASMQDSLLTAIEGIRSEYGLLVLPRDAG